MTDIVSNPFGFILKCAFFAFFMELFLARFRLKDVKIKFVLLQFVIYAAILVLVSFLTPYFVAMFDGLGAGGMSKAYAFLASLFSAACLLISLGSLVRKSPLNALLRPFERPVRAVDKEAPQ